MGLSLGFSKGRLLLEAARKNDIAFKQQQEKRKQLSQDMELISSNNKSNETAKEEIDIKSEDVPSDIIMSNLGINLIKRNLIANLGEAQISSIRCSKSVAQGELRFIEFDIEKNKNSLSVKKPTTRSQEDIQKDLDTLTSRIEKATKTSYVQIPATNIFTKTEQLSKGKIKATFKNGKTMTFKNQKEYNNYLKSRGTIQKIQSETPISIKLRQQKQELEKELDSAKTRDNITELKQQKEQLENKIAGYDEKLKELEGQRLKMLLDSANRDEERLNMQLSAIENQKKSVEEKLNSQEDEAEIAKAERRKTQLDNQTIKIKNTLEIIKKRKEDISKQIENIERTSEENESLQKIIDDNIDSHFKLFA